MVGHPHLGGHVRVRDEGVHARARLHHPQRLHPDNSGKNDNFRIRGLDGFAGSKLIVYNRYGTVVYTKETASDAEFELVWNGNFANGNPAPAGVYQWVLLRADGLKDSGELSLMR